MDCPIDTIDSIDHCGLYINGEPAAFNDEGQSLTGVEVIRMLKDERKRVFEVEDEIGERAFFYNENVVKALGYTTDRARKLEDCPEWVIELVRKASE